MKVLCVDFDGTLCKNAWPAIGKPKRFTIWRVKRKAKKGWTIILWTCREGKMLNEALGWSQYMGIPIHYANKNAPHKIAEYGNDCRKIGADLYFDDKARRIF